MQRDIRHGEEVTEVVFEAVAEETGRSPRTLRPLGELFDTDAIESLFARSARTSPESLTILYEGCRVTIGEGAVAVERIPGV